MKIVQMIQSNDGKVFETVDAAKAHEISLLPDLQEEIETAREGATMASESVDIRIVQRITSWMVNYAPSIIAILQDKPSDKKPRKRRSDAGLPKKPVAA